MDDFVFTQEELLVLDRMERTQENIFLTGRAGTGKSTLLRHFQTHSAKKLVVLAPTGVAAINVDGQTIHSFFGFAPGITVDDAGRRHSRRSAFFKEIEAIVIDEISMVRADLLDCVDQFLRANGRNKKLPFGGVQMIFIGDLYQLPPVVGGGEEAIFETAYESPYFFSAHSFQSLDIHCVELKDVHRQSDPEFIAVLDALRISRVEDGHLEIINQRVVDEQFDFSDDAYVYLVPTNGAASTINNAKLGQIQSGAFISEGVVAGDFFARELPTESRLFLKRGAQVMLLNNDQRGRWVNGDVGFIEDIKKDADGTLIVDVRLSDGTVHAVERHTWEKIKYIYNKDAKKIESQRVGSFAQYPLRLAWALTIHKAQGKTFDKMIIDFGHGTFAHGQAYVALSRCRSLDGLWLVRPLEKRHAFIDRRVENFMKRFESGADLQQGRQKLFT